MLRPIYSLSTICYVDFDDLNNKHNIVLSSPFALFSCSLFLLNSLTLLSSYSTSTTKFSYTLFILTTTLHQLVPESCFTSFPLLKFPHRRQLTTICQDHHSKKISLGRNSLSISVILFLFKKKKKESRVNIEKTIQVPHRINQV